MARTPSPRAALLSDPTKSMAAAAPPPVARRIRLAASGARASTTSAPASAPGGEGRVVDVGDDDGGAGQRLREPQGREADAAETDDDERAPVDPRPDLPHRAKRGEPRAGVGAGEGHRQIADVEEVSGMRDEHAVAEPARPGDPERPRLRAQVLVPRSAGVAAAAAYPGVGHVPSPRVDAGGLGAASRNHAGDLVPQRQRQRPAPSTGPAAGRPPCRRTRPAGEGRCGTRRRPPSGGAPRSPSAPVAATRRAPGRRRTG